MKSGGLIGPRQPIRFEDTVAVVVYARNQSEERNGGWETGAEVNARQAKGWKGRGGAAGVGHVTEPMPR